MSASAEPRDAATVPNSALVWVQLFRPHILSIVYASTLTYGFIFSETHDFVLPLIAVWDWFIVNFTNKATDVAEDMKNGIPGAEAIGRHRRAVEFLNAALILTGLFVGLFFHPELLPFRVLFTLIGLAYNYRIIVVPKRPPGGPMRLVRTRLKEMYFWKNFGSSLLFTLSVFFYPLFGSGADEGYPVANLLLAILFFIPLELTYEILYDLRDVEGDTAEGIPTYPVVHGRERALRIIYGLIAISALFPIVGALSGMLRLREWVVLAGCVQQLVVVYLLTRHGRRPSQSDTELATYLGAAQLFSYNLWVAAGLPLGE